MPEAQAGRHDVAKRSIRVSRLRQGRAPLMVVRTAITLVAIGAVALIGSVPGSYALWTSSATVVPGTVQAGSIKTDIAIDPSLDVTYKAGNFTRTGGLRITNSGTVGADYTANVTMGAGTSAQFLTGLTAYVWKTSSLSTCTSGAEIPAGAFPVIAPPNGTLAARGVDIYCIRTSFTPGVIPSGDFALLQLTITLHIGGWTSSDTEVITQAYDGTVTQ